jgi:hypothetical protein
MGSELAPSLAKFLGQCFKTAHVTLSNNSQDRQNLGPPSAGLQSLFLHTIVLYKVYIPLKDI